jgi:hypothetical protein
MLDCARIKLALTSTRLFSLHRCISTPSDRALLSPSGEWRRLRNAVSVAIVVKMLAIVALMLTFSALSERPRISPQSMFQAAAPFGPSAKGESPR